MNWALAAINLADKLTTFADKIWTAKEKSKFTTLAAMYNEEIHKDEDIQDNDLIAWLEEDLEPFVRKAIEYQVPKGNA